VPLAPEARRDAICDVRSKPQSPLRCHERPSLAGNDQPQPTQLERSQLARRVAHTHSSYSHDHQYTKTLPLIPNAHPPNIVQRLVAEIATLERQTIPALARGLLDQLAARETELDGDSAQGARAACVRSRRRAIERPGCVARLSMTEELYTLLQKRYEEARLAEASTIPDVRILDAAVVSREPVSSPGGRMILLGFCGSFGLAVVGAVLLDRIDPRVRYPDQVSREMGLAILGAVPHLRTLPHAGATAGAACRRTSTRSWRPFAGCAQPRVRARGTGTAPGHDQRARGLGTASHSWPQTWRTPSRTAASPPADRRRHRRGVLHRRLNARRRPGLSDFLRGETPPTPSYRRLRTPRFLS